MQTGPAVHVPDDIKRIKIQGYRAEWLNISTPQENFFAKNHMVSTLLFAQPKIIGGIKYASARLSMELGEKWKVAEIAAGSVGSTRTSIPT